LIVPWKSEADIWSEAEKIRNACWDSSIPVDVDVIVEKELGLNIIPIPNLTQLISSDAYLTGDLKEIDYDDSANGFRLRFSIAHEIGHFVLHPDQIRQLRFASFIEWKNTINVLPAGVWGRAEYQAREFAGRLLVPLPQLMEAIRELKPVIEDAKEKTKDIEFDWTQSLISGIAREINKRFEVSASVIATRIKSEKINLLDI